MKLLLRVGRQFSVTLENYSVIETDIAALKGQMMFRSKNLGVRELDLIVGTWAKYNIPNYSHQQLLQFNQEVLHHETPDLLKKILGQLPISPEEGVI
jgi:succinate dehydrogenase flavin-adding protein (antitoxin of CptAB toxin-antitoxin module)